MHAGAGLPLANAAGVERLEGSSPPPTAPETTSRTTQILPHRSTCPVHSPCGPQGREGAPPSTWRTEPGPGLIRGGAGDRQWLRRL